MDEEIYLKVDEEALAKMYEEMGVSDEVKRNMFESSEKVVKVPVRLFHGTPLKNFSSIRENGIYAHKVFGQSYHCLKVNHCLHFVDRPCVVFEIVPEMLDKKRLVYSRDHNKKILNFDTFAYYEDVPAKVIKDWKVFY